MGASGDRRHGLRSEAGGEDSRSRRAASRQAIRDALVTAADELFEEVGYGAARTSEIARRARVAQATLFRYFPTKADLALFRLQGAIAGLVDEVLEHPRSDPPHDALMRAVERRELVECLNSRDSHVEGERLVAHVDLAAHLCWVAHGHVGRLAADFEARLDAGRGAPLPRALAATVVDATLDALRVRYQGVPHEDRNWLARAMWELRPLFIAVSAPS